MNKTNWRDGYVKGKKMPMYQLGIDVSKNTLDLCLLREGIKGRIKTRKLKNTADAAKVVAEWLKKQSC